MLLLLPQLLPQLLLLLLLIPTQSFPWPSGRAQMSWIGQRAQQTNFNEGKSNCPTLLLIFLGEFPMYGIGLMNRQWPGQLPRPWLWPSQQFNRQIFNSPTTGDIRPGGSDPEGPGQAGPSFPGPAPGPRPGPIYFPPARI